jgi:two-component system, OmpR family, sensor histidine kinase KdpD
MDSGNRMEITSSDVRRVSVQISSGLLGVALITLVCFPARRLVIPGFLYLLLVVIESLWGGFASAAIVSVAAALCLEYFFIPPVLEWQIDDPEDFIALLTYLVTSLIITRLASKARSEARRAEQGRRDVTLLYQAASRLLSLGPEMAAGPESLQIFREVFGLSAVCFFDDAAARLQIEGESRQELGAKTRDASITGADYQDNNLYIRCLRTGRKITGSVGFEGTIADGSVALALSVLAATALERMRAFRSANKAFADAHAEALRSAILDAFAHEFKTPLAIILTAAGGLRETRGEPLEQMEMTEIIENQTLRLTQLTTRLLRIARLDRDEVEPMMELTSLHQFLGRLVAQCDTQFGGRVLVALGPEPAEIMADPELLGLAITQLLDNACKYSNPGSVVKLTMDVEGQHADIRVSNEGASIAADNQERIFERFFRGPETEHIAPGSGLGLYVARKIVLAHGGTLELDRNSTNANFTTFHVRLPMITQENHYEQEAGQSVGSRR